MQQKQTSHENRKRKETKDPKQKSKKTQSKARRGAQFFFSPLSIFLGPAFQSPPSPVLHSLGLLPGTAAAL
jgi:hypothetical protein